MCFGCQNSLPSLRFPRFLLCVFSKSFSFQFTFKAMIYIELIVWGLCEVWSLGRVSFFVPAQFVQKAILTWLRFFCTFLKSLFFLSSALCLIHLCVCPSTTPHGHGMISWVLGRANSSHFLNFHTCLNCYRPCVCLYYLFICSLFFLLWC
jgi:hypothetical protein